MNDQFTRIIMLFGHEAMQKLKNASVAIFGIGGVGGHCAEALARSGIGSIDLYDQDKVSITNLNRQIVALHSTIGMYKVDVMAERIKDINPDCRVRAFKIFYMPDTADDVELKQYDYVIDAIDTVTGKVELIVRSKAAGVKIICAMGAGNKLDPMKFAVVDIFKTETDPLARVMRKELRARNITDVKVVCSTEIVFRDGDSRVPASNAFVPPVCGLILAGEVVKSIISK